MKKQIVFFFIFLIMGNMMILAQSCNINAGANTVICGTSANLSGSPGGSTLGNPLWTLVSKPSGAPDPVIVTPSGYNTNVTGMTSPGNYVFQIAQNCTTGTAASQVTITAPGAVSTFTAGPDITNVSASTGTATLNAVIPAGYTASWTYYNIYNNEYYGQNTTTNATMSNATTASPTLTLIKKANHDIDPAYRAVLRITSVNNPNCWYEDDAIVRFIPNPQISLPATHNRCYSSTETNRYISLSGTSPMFASNTTNSSGNPAFGTTVTLNVISQPAGGNISFYQIRNNSVYFNGVSVTGSYVFTMTITNANGTYTTPQITYNYNGTDPKLVSFIDSSYPEQMMVYSSGGSGGAVYCNMAGKTTPITFYFKIDPSNQASITTSVSNSGITPPGGNPTLVLNGAGTMNRNVIVTPPSGGWRAGTYVVGLSTGDGLCKTSQSYYIHISDGNRPNVSVPNTTICYSGSGVVTATVPLPAVYQGAVNSSYLQGFSGRYDFTLVSKPAGAANPVYEAGNLRTFTNTSTTISNLDKQGEYVFKIKAVPSAGGVDSRFLDKEYACSGTSLEGTFSIFVSAQVGANAGSAQTLIGAAQTSFNANNPGVAATGAWTLLTKPVGATDPVIVTPSAYNTNVTGFNSPGTYTFRWTVTTGTCTSASDLTVNVINAVAGGVSGADFWVKSDDAGVIATAWKDQSANADNIPNVGGITLSPADRAHNFHPYTTGYSASKFFYNTNSVLNTTNNYLDPSMRSSVSVFSAVRPTSTNGTGRITGIDDDANASEPGISINSGIPHIYKYFGNGGAQANSNTMSAANPFTANKSSVFSAIQDQALNSGRGERRLGLDGIYEAFNLDTTTNTFNVLGKHLRIGHAGWDSPGAFPGDIMEVLWYKRALTPNEQSRVNSYLAVKNGTTLNENYLSTTSSIVWDRTNNAGYNNNIFGIARDNITALHQKQSGSTNIGQKLVISTTGFTDSNSANATGLASDLQFLMTGDNGLNQSLTTPLSYTAGSNGATNYRFESIWKVQNSGSVGTVTVAWPKSIKNMYLVQSTDAVFDDTDTFTPMATEVTVNGVVYNTANVTLTNGQFFTFAGFGNAPGGVVTGLSYWYRADKNVANTGAATDVTGWTDVWNGTTVGQMGTNLLPKYVEGTTNYFNFNPGINFTLDTQSLGNISVQTLTSLNYDIFTFTKEGMSGTRFFNIGRNNIPNNGDNWDSPAFEPGGRIARRNNAGGGPVYWANPGNNYVTGIPSIAYTTFTDINLKRGVNGSTLLGPAGNHTAIGLVTGGHIFGRNSGTLTLGDDAGFTGHIGETIVYGTGTLTTTERRKVDSYLAIKYGITLGQVNTDHYLDADAAIVWNGVTNPTHNNNIFGVAREDIGLFEQKVSKSVNSGSILTVATTNDFVNSNQDAARTGFAQDKTYLLLGDNNNTTLVLNSITVNGYTGGSRIQRQWLAQPTNAVGMVNFGADLTSYGAGFESGDSVKMIVADDASFTTNVVYVSGTFDTTTGKWAHPYTFASGQNKYITYITVDETSCTTGCNDNTYLNATDPNTIEYDNLIAGDDSIIAKGKDGAFYIWGYNTSPNVSSTNSNVVLNLLTPTKIDPSTSLPTTGSSGVGFNYTGTPLKAAIANVYHLLTTDGLYVWGNGNMYTLNTIGNTAITYRTPSGYKFGKLTVNNKADGLPPGVSPDNVKMMFGNQFSLAIVTCSGAAWTLSQASAYYGDGGTTESIANNSIWHRVKTSSSETLDNVVAVRGSAGAKFALTSEGKLYTWGRGTYIGDGTDNAITGTNRAFATEVVVPAGVTPKMIGMTEDAGFSNHAYFLLATNGKLYAMGHNGEGILGDGTNTSRNTWQEVTAASGSNTLGGNIAWISPSEHGVDTFPTMNVLTSDKKQWGWGSNYSYKLGQSNTTGQYYTPIYMPGNTTNTDGMGLNDEMIAVETGGKFTINYKKSSPYFGFVGLSSYGTIGNGTTGIPYFQKYTYNTGLVDMCGLLSSAVCYKPGIIAGTALNTKVGITSLGRAGAESTDNWPMVRKGGWLALEAKTKGFVPNRVKFNASNQPVAADGVTPVITAPVEGMMVYDTTNKCMKIYTLKEGDASMAWHCISTQTCPD
ncbi:hypothetical protein MP478_01765 [Chryseobacterium sp. WG14]|uniref:hypothetical protein n=1 Tax=Chryseobacterium sp. WG14 TaxID=2926909 RepID=UPI00211DA918|nr:hypothetical protein [Chryseobacterium sp. WG14]MCQ9638100.1 hypothetical protein [Chryseobacterium sp. WG14]